MIHSNNNIMKKIEKTYVFDEGTLVLEGVTLAGVVELVV